MELVVGLIVGFWVGVATVILFLEFLWRTTGKG